VKYKDYYATLGVERNATEAAIKAAYRKLAHKYHPDVSKEPDAEEKFKEVAEAYKTLKDPEQRAAYDRLGTHPAGEEFQPSRDWEREFNSAGAGAGFGTGAEDFDLSELFAQLRGGRAGGRGARGGARSGAGAAGMALPGQDFEIPIELSIENSFSGTELELNLRMPEYDAQGRLREVPKSVKVRIPKGATDGQRLRIPGKGGKGFGGGRDGDLYLDITLRPHPRFRVDGHDLYLDLPLAPWEAVLGAQVEIPTPGGAVRLRIPAGTQAGRQLRLPGRGLPQPGGGSGNLYALVQIVVPATQSDAERALYEQLKASSNFDPRARFGEESGDAH